MSKRWFWLALFAGCLTIGLVAWKVTAKPCYACNTQPPAGCSSAMSASTVRYGDQRTAWWNFLDKREDNKMNMYLGANYVHGTSPAEATYQITTSDPNVEVEPELVTFNLASAGSAGSNDTKVITVPYTKTGTFTVTANPVINKGDCQFPPKVTAFQVNSAGPTVWPIMPRVCPLPDEKPRLVFGVRNSSDKAQTYRLRATASDPFGGAETYNLNGKGSVADLGTLDVGAGDTEEVEINCETFGACIAGGENYVRLEVSPTAGSEQFPTAFAESNVSLSAPDAACPKIEDWWFLMSPLLFWSLVGVPIGLVLLGSGAFMAFQKINPYTGNGHQDSRKKPGTRPPTGTGAGGVSRK